MACAGQPFRLCYHSGYDTNNFPSFYLLLKPQGAEAGRLPAEQTTLQPCQALTGIYFPWRAGDWCAPQQPLPGLGNRPSHRRPGCLQTRGGTDTNRRYPCVRPPRPAVLEREKRPYRARPGSARTLLRAEGQVSKPTGSAGLPALTGLRSLPGRAPPREARTRRAALPAGPAPPPRRRYRTTLRPPAWPRQIRHGKGLRAGAAAGAAPLVSAPAPSTAGPPAQGGAGHRGATTAACGKCRRGHPDASLPPPLPPTARPQRMKTNSGGDGGGAAQAAALRAAAARPPLPAPHPRRRWHPRRAAAEPPGSEIPAGPGPRRGGGGGALAGAPGRPWGSWGLEVAGPRPREPPRARAGRWGDAGARRGSGAAGPHRAAGPPRGMSRRAASTAAPAQVPGPGWGGSSGSLRAAPPGEGDGDVGLKALAAASCLRFTFASLLAQWGFAADPCARPLGCGLLGTQWGWGGMWPPETSLSGVS